MVLNKQINSYSLLLLYINWICKQTAWLVPLFSLKNMTCKVLRTKIVNIRHTSMFYIIDHYLTGHLIKCAHWRKQY